MNGRDSDGSDSFEADSIIEEAGPTIRIPNPKMYLARQSQWKGRRGKPRCDYCRTNNLKCDREQPICNHCSWSSLSDCKYTPLPTPAHRGIPRCDRCRLRNLKCDRNLPICNNCMEGEGGECNYTPKKRHKIPADSNGMKEQPISYGSKTAAFLVSDMGSSNFAVTEAVMQDPADPSTLKLKQRMSPHGIFPISSGSNTTLHYQGEGLIQPDPEVPPYYHSPSRTSDDSTWIRQFVSVPGSDRSRRIGLNLTATNVEPWSNSNFAPFPANVIQALRATNTLDMPNRQTFDDALSAFLAGLSKELQETAAFSPEVYTEIAQALSQEDASGLSPRLRTWALCHHLRSGSRKFHLIVVPRDPYHSISAEEEEKLLLVYLRHVDGMAPDPILDEGDTSLSSVTYERIPVQPQIYDLLAYAHRTHGPPSSVLSEVRRIGMTGVTWPMVEIFTRLCPLCRSRHKGSSGDQNQ